MFETGFGELVLLFVIGLLVLGPQRLPKVAAEIGKWVGRARRTASELRRQLEREIELSEITKSTPPPPAEPGAEPTPPDTEPTPLPPDPFTAEAQHGQAPQPPPGADSSAESAAPAVPAAPADPPPAAESIATAPPAAPESPAHSQEPVSSPSQH